MWLPKALGQPEACRAVEYASPTTDGQFPCSTCFLSICLSMVWTLKTDKNSEHCTHTIPFLSLSSTISYCNSQSSLKALLLPAFRRLLLLSLEQGTESSFAPSSTLLMFSSSTCTVSVARVDKLHPHIEASQDPVRPTRLSSRLPVAALPFQKDAIVRCSFPRPPAAA